MQYVYVSGDLGIVFYENLWQFKMHILCSHTIELNVYTKVVEYYNTIYEEADVWSGQKGIDPSAKIMHFCVLAAYACRTRDADY